MRRIWIDTDMGFDDLAAVAMVAAAEGVAVAGLSLVAGNAPLPRVVRNACAAAEVFGWPFAIHAGAARPLAGPLVTAAYVLGPDGMPSTGRRLPEPASIPDPVPALAALCRFLEEGGREILALGPLTNIAALAIARPELVPAIGRLVWMGGSAGPGNHSAAAEFNAFVDPEALQCVIDAGVRVEMVGLDTCRQVPVTARDAAALRARGADRALLLADLLDGYVRIADPEGLKTMALYDPVAAAAIIDPAAVAFREARLDAELSGRLTRGMTVIEWRARKAAPNALVAVTADASRVRALFMDGLSRVIEGAPA